MGILEHFFPPPDPADAWIRRTNRLDCVLDEPSFSNLHLGDPAESISRFGPPENSRPTRDGMYDYPSQGFEIDATDGKIDCICFRWDAMNPARHFRGTFSWNGRTVTLGPQVREGDFQGMFGVPYWIDDDLGEKIFFYEFRKGELEWQVEFVRGRLTVLSIMTPGLLSHPQVRTDYKVTRAWPPI